MPLLTRRSLLLGAAAGIVLAGCRDQAPPPRRVPTAEELAREAAASEEQRLLDEYATAVAVHSTLSTRLAPLAEHHRRHIAVLVRPASPSPTPSASPSAAPVGTPAQTMQRLAELEHQLAGVHRAALPAASADLGLLFASLAASAAANAAELGRRA